MSNAPADYVRDDYEMYTPEGDKVVAVAVNTLIAAGVNGAFTRMDLGDRIVAMCEEIEATHPEVYDTEPQFDIADEINRRLCRPLMWQTISRWDW